MNERRLALFTIAAAPWPLAPNQHHASVVRLSTPTDSYTSNDYRGSLGGERTAVPQDDFSSHLV